MVDRDTYCRDIVVRLVEDSVNMTDEAKYCKRCWNTLRFLGTDLMMHCSYCGDQITVSEEGIMMAGHYAMLKPCALTSGPCPIFPGGVSFKKVYRCKPNTFAGNVRPRLVSNDHMSAGATVSFWGLC